MPGRVSENSQTQCLIVTKNFVLNSFEYLEPEVLAELDSMSLKEEKRLSDMVPFTLCFNLCREKQ